METKILRINRDALALHKEEYEAAFSEAADLIHQGGLVAFPTETVYGLGADATNPFASEKIYRAKGRPSDNPLIVHIYDKSQLQEYAAEVPPLAHRLAERFWPGPLTLIFKKSDKIPLQTSGGLDTVGIRMPDDPVALAFLRACGRGIAAPSANTSGRPSPTLAAHVIEDMQGKIDMILDGGDVFFGIESTIVDLTGEKPQILRPGAVTEEMLREVDAEITTDPALLREPVQECRPKAPGMKYRHYAPKAKLCLLRGENEKVLACMQEKVQRAREAGKRVGLILTDENRGKLQADEIRYIGSAASDEQIAHNLFAVLREFDHCAVDLIYSESFEQGKLAAAIMNRLLKAAAYHIADV